MSRPADYLAAPARRLHVFVPALMSVGFAFWLGALLRDVFRRHGDAKLERRARVAGPAVAELTRTGSTEGLPETGLRPRRTYLLVALPFLALAIYLTVVATRNYTDPEGGVSEIGWLLAVLLGIAVIVAVAGGALLAVAILGPRQTPRTRRLAATTPVGTVPEKEAPAGEPGGSSARTARRLAVGLWVALAAVVALALLVDLTSLLESFDERVVDALADDDWLEPIEALDPLGSRVVTVIAAALLGLAGFRCRPLLIAYPVVVIGGLVANNLGQAFVPRERPAAGAHIGDMDSFPSGHLIQITLILGVLPLTLQVLTRRHHRFRWVGAVALVVVGLTAVHRIRQGAHWPTDVLAGILIGVALALLAWWIVAHPAWHRRCDHCPWQIEEMALDDVAPLRGAIPVEFGTARVFRLLAHLAAFGVSLLLAVLAMTRGIPLDTDGVFLDEQIQRTSQLVLAGMVSLGAVLSWRWDAVGAVLMAIAATGLGIFAAVQYQPLWAFAMTVVVLVPAVLLWLSWQHHRTAAEIIALAGVTLALAGFSWVGIRWVHAQTLGPTHPDSEAVLAPVDEVEWVWSGGVTADSATVVARLDDDEAARLHLEPGGIVATATTPDEDDLVRFELDGLSPDTTYTYRIEVAGELDEGRGNGSFRTPAEGPASFRFAFASCARSGTNGAVFDSIAADDPLFMLVLGDLHYSNIDRADAGLFGAAFDRLLDAPGPAEMFRDVPISYIWDDHDYGPDDADSSSPTRDVAREVFRSSVPSHPLAVTTDGPIHRAFTIGRVRFILTDTRSERTPTTMLGADQLEWLLEELVEASETHALVVWGNPTPWVGPADDTSDSWAGRSAERELIADEIATAGIDNLVMVSGDAHMLAYDDGTNTGYQRGGGAGFPLVHAAALDRPGTEKGGPYSGGTFPGGGQYAVIDVDDDGETIVVHVEGKTWDGEVLIDETLEFAA